METFVVVASRQTALAVGGTRAGLQRQCPQKSSLCLAQAHLAGVGGVGGSWALGFRE